MYDVRRLLKVLPTTRWRAIFVAFSVLEDSEIEDWRLGQGLSNQHTPIALPHGHRQKSTAPCVVGDMLTNGAHFTAAGDPTATYPLREETRVGRWVHNSKHGFRLFRQWCFTTAMPCRLLLLIAASRVHCWT